MNEAPTNEALAAQAKAGDREALAALWEQNRGLLRIMFSRLAAACRERMDAAGVTIEDLEQEGYFAVEERIAERIEAHTERYTADAFIADMMKIYQCSRAEVLQRFPELCG